MDGGIIMTACRRFEPVIGGGRFSRKGNEMGTWKSVVGMEASGGVVEGLGFICGGVHVALSGSED